MAGLPPKFPRFHRKSQQAGAIRVEECGGGACRHERRQTQDVGARQGCLDPNPEVTGPRPATGLAQRTGSDEGQPQDVPPWRLVQSIWAGGSAYSQRGSLPRRRLG